MPEVAILDHTIIKATISKNRYGFICALSNQCFAVTDNVFVTKTNGWLFIHSHGATGFTLVPANTDIPAEAHGAIIDRIIKGEPAELYVINVYSIIALIHYSCDDIRNIIYFALLVQRRIPTDG